MDELKIKQEVLKLYPKYKLINGPYKRKDGRKHIILTNGKYIRRTLSWSKALLEVKIKRRLKNSETTDHINEDFSNDEFDNLQILTRRENAKKSCLKRVKQFVKCVLCNRFFIPSSNQINKRSKKKAGPFCSKKCLGRYGKSIQLGGVILKRKQIKIKYIK